MKVEVSLYGTLAQYLPKGTQGRTAIVDCPDGVTVGQVIDQLGIPKPYPTMLLVNGIHADPDTPLQAGDLLALFPPLAGGSLVYRSEQYTHLFLLVSCPGLCERYD